MLALLLALALQLPTPPAFFDIVVDVRPYVGPGVKLERASLVDGDPATWEWVANGRDPAYPETFGKVAVVAYRVEHGRAKVCVGPWVDVRANATEWFDVNVVHDGRFQKLAVQTEPYGVYREMPLWPLLPVCRP